MEKVGKLFEDYAKAAWNLARALSRTAEDADDIVQQAFTIAVKKRSEVPPHAWPWLARVVANCARNNIRHKARRQGMEDVHQAHVPCRDENPADAASRREIAQSLHLGLAELSIEEREAVALCHVSGLTQSQASEVAGVELNTLKSRVRRGLQHLQQKLGLSEAAATSYLSTIAFPPPEGGWESAIARWQAHCSSPIEAGVASSSQLSLWVAGLAALASLASLAGFGIWLTMDSAMPARTPPGASLASMEGDRAADSVARPVVRGAPASEERGPGAAGSSSGKADDPPKAAPETPKTEPTDESKSAANESAGKFETRFAYYNTGLLQMRWTERKAGEKWVKEGDFLHLWPTGNVREKGQYLNDQRTGLWLHYHEDNTPAIEGGYSKDKPEGVWKTFDEKGNLESEGRFESGLQIGVWITYHANGQRALIQHLSAGKLNGLETEFDKQGRKRRETLWEQNRKRGLEIIFDENEVEVSRQYHEGK